MTFTRVFDLVLILGEKPKIKVTLTLDQYPKKGIQVKMQSLRIYRYQKHQKYLKFSNSLRETALKMWFSLRVNKRGAKLAYLKMAL
jgi:hypothetical protein